MIMISIQLQRGIIYNKDKKIYIYIFYKCSGSSSIFSKKALSNTSV